jgi:hypothetical protein
MGQPKRGQLGPLYPRGLHLLQRGSRSDDVRITSISYDPCERFGVRSMKRLTDFHEAYCWCKREVGYLADPNGGTSSVALLDTSKVDGEGDITRGIRDHYPPASPVSVRFRAFPAEFAEGLDGLSANLLEIGHANSDFIRNDFVSVGQVEIVPVHPRSRIINLPARQYWRAGAAA